MQMTQNKVRVKTGGFEVIDSGCVITHRGQPLNFVLGTLEMVVTFVGDVLGAEPGPGWRQVGENRIEATLPVGPEAPDASTEPIRMGTYNNRALYLSYLAAPASPSRERIFYYTWFLEEKPLSLRGALGEGGR